MYMSPFLKALACLRDADVNASSISPALRTSRSPRPPPPPTALRSTGYPIASAASRAADASASTPSLPGIGSSPRFRIVRRATALSPIKRIDSERGRRT
jgi:hypothetical protein